MGKTYRRNPGKNTYEEEGGKKKNKRKAHQKKETSSKELEKYKPWRTIVL